MQISGLNQQNFLIYQPAVDGASKAQTLTPGLWQSQMQKLVGILQGTPPAHASTPVQPVAGRHGKVLKADNFLKTDQYPGLHSKRLQDGRTHNVQPLIDGAPNYRELGEGIHGTAQPTVDGMRAVLRQAGAGPDGNKRALWTNLREEPVLYINGKPYNLRHIKAPFYNQASPGRTAREVEKMERDLKKDVLAEIERNGGTITLHDEDAGPPPHVVEQQVKVDNVQTVSEVYDQLQHEGFKVDYQRVPVTDMKKPEDRDVDELVQALKKAGPDTELIFNCHAGQGRTTTAMVLASMIRRAENGEDTSVLKDKALREDIKEQGHHQTRNYRDVLRAVKDAQKLLGSQEEADKVIERYGDVANLKADVAKARGSVDKAKTPEERKAAQERVADYLERYHTLIAFEQYAQDAAPDFKLTYSQWKRRHPEVDENLARMQLAMAGGVPSSDLA